MAETLIATSTDQADDLVAAFCEREGVPYTRGSQYDVLDRYYQAAHARAADVIVRITGDCPLVDPGLIDQVVATLLAGPYDFACNRLPPPWHRTFPIGLDVEACRVEVLDRAWREATQPHHREHVMPYIYEDVRLERESASLEHGISPGGFRIALQHHSRDLGSYRWTVDATEDLVFVRRVLAMLQGRENFSWTDVLEIVEADPSLMEINQGVRHNMLGDFDGRVGT